MGRKLKEDLSDSLDDIFKAFKKELNLHRERQKEIVEGFMKKVNFLKKNHTNSIDKTFKRDVRRIQLEDNKKSVWKLPSIIGPRPFQGKHKRLVYCDCSSDGSDLDSESESEVDDDDDDDDFEDEDEKKDQRHINGKCCTLRIQRNVQKGRKYPPKPKRKNFKKKQSLAKLKISSISKNELKLKQNLLHLINEERKNKTDTGAMNCSIPMTEQQNLEMPGPSGHSGSLIVNMPMGCNPVKKKAFKKQRKK
ncbi:uncharacterized protein LOC119688128 [Teleopsis dalmanni]|uniref:uncharacterized protein LOC119688128 n=1 Tax=Teleopsis dalmanni TaxID=139649 RepID=UPI0018CEB3F9|nr:uncharacterized protein LOC119688128 [Teleopsis dalmanni]